MTVAIQKIDVSSLVEQKITRTEMIDIIVGELVEDIQVKRDAAKAAEDAAQKAFETIEANADLFLKFLKNPTVELNYPYNREKDTIQIEFKVRIPQKNLPKEYVDARKAVKKAHEIRLDFDSKIEKLTSNRQKVRNEIIKASLGTSVEGQSLLDMMGSFKASLKAKMLAAKNEE